MRSGELYGLTWDQIDFEKDLIFVHQAYETRTKIMGPTKGRYWRVIPISKTLRAFLIEHKSKQVLNGTEDDQYVLKRSRSWRNGDQSYFLKRFLNEIGIRPVKFHTLRACWATQMLANGISSAIVMRIGGWKRSSTMDIYLRLAGVDVKGATECLDFIPEAKEMGENVVQLF